MPKRYSEDHAFLRPYTSALLKEELLTVVPPNDSVSRAGAENYFQAFVDLVNSDPFGVARLPAHQREWVPLHVDKLGAGLGRYLREKELAKDDHWEEESSWVQVERHTADLLMAFLASLVGKDPDVAMDPITDSERSMAAFTTLPEQERQINTELDPIRYALLENVLPGPAGTINVPKLAAFKADHQQLLKPFRNRVEKEVFDCAQIADMRFRAEGEKRAQSRLLEELCEIEARMNERKLGPLVRGSLGVVAPALGLADALIGGGSLMAILGTSLGVAGAADSAFRGARRRDILQGPLAYAALARRDFASTGAG